MSDGYALGQMNGQRVLITGGLGFIGSNLAHTLVSLGAEVTIYDALLDPYGWNFANIKEIKDAVTFVKGDTRDAPLLGKHVAGKDLVFNLAAQVSHGLSIEDPLLDIDINCMGNMNLLEACRKLNDSAKIVYTGTRGQVGEAQYLPVDEKHPDNPTDINGINKLAAEKYLMLYNKVYGLKGASIRVNNTYGIRHQMRHGQYGVLNWFIRRAMLGETIEIYGDGKQLRDYNYVEDVVDALILAAQSGKSNGEVFLIGSGEKVEFADMVRMVLAAVGKGEFRMRPFPEKEKEAISVRNFVADWGKINRILGWRPKTKLKTGIEKTVEFYRARLEEYI